MKTILFVYMGTTDLNISEIKKKLLELLRRPQPFVALARVLKSYNHDCRLETLLTILADVSPCYIYPYKAVPAAIKTTYQSLDKLKASMYETLNRNLVIYSSSYAPRLLEELHRELLHLLDTTSWIEIDVRDHAIKTLVLAYRCDKHVFYAVTSNGRILEHTDVRTFLSNVASLILESVKPSELLVRIPIESDFLRLKYRCIFIYENIMVTLMNALLLSLALKKAVMKERPC